MLYKVYFDNGNPMSDCKLLEGRPGPAKVEPRYAGGLAKVAAGWNAYSPKGGRDGPGRRLWAGWW